MVKVYSKDNCMQCKMTKRWLKEHNIDFEEANVSSDENAMAEARATGYTSMPIVMQGDVVLASGFQPTNLAKL